MTFRDVEEMLILAFELINGREIPSLVFQYSGRWKYARVLDDLEIKRSQYRVAQARGGNRIRALAAYLVETEYVTREELPDGLTISQLIDQVTGHIDTLAEKISATCATSDVHSKNGFKKDLERLVNIMRTCLELYQMAHKAYIDTGKRHKQLMEASGKWEKITSEAYGNPGSLRLNAKKRGLRIQENTIALNKEARLEVCRHLAWYFEKHESGYSGTLLHAAPGYGGAMSARRLALEIALALEPHIRLSKPEIQRNINATKAIYLGELSSEMNAVQKSELGQRMAREADDRLDIAAEQLAETLVRLYHVDLTDDAKDFLHYTYGSRYDVLENLEQQTTDPGQPASSPNVLPPQVQSPKPEWKKAFVMAKKVLAK